MVKKKSLAFYICTLIIGFIFLGETARADF